MTQELLWSVLLLAVLVGALAIKLKYEGVKKPSFYGSIICLGLAGLSLVMAQYQSYWLTACGFLLFLIFGLLFVYITSAGGTNAKKVLHDAPTSTGSCRWINELCALLQQYPRMAKVLALLTFGGMAAFFVLGISAAILGGMFDESDLISAENQVSMEPTEGGALTRSAAVGMTIVLGLVTVIVTFIFGLVFVRDGISIGFTAGVWVGLIVVVIGALITEPFSRRIFIAASSTVCGYLGGNFGLWTRNAVGRLYTGTRGST